MESVVESIKAINALVIFCFLIGVAVSGIITAIFDLFLMVKKMLTKETNEDIEE